MGLILTPDQGVLAYGVPDGAQTYNQSAHRTTLYPSETRASRFYPGQTLWRSLPSFHVLFDGDQVNRLDGTPFEGGRMNEIIEHMGKLIAFAMAIITPIGWLFRLEGRVNANARELARLEKQRENDLAEARGNRAEQNEILKEMRGDIKTLIREGRVVHHTDRTLPPR